MRLIATLILALVAATPAFAVKINGQLEKALLEKLAADPATSTEARIYYNTGTKKAKIHDGTSWTELGSGTGTGDVALFPNLLTNPGAETNTSDWTASGGTFLRTTTASDVARGVGAFNFDPFVTNDAVTVAAITIPPGMYGKNGAASCKFKFGNAQTKFQVYDGTNVLIEQEVPQYSDYTRITLNFIFPSSGSLSLRVIATTNTATSMYWDDCFLGDANAVNLGSVSQATLYGSITYAGATNCTWVATTPTSYANYGADTDCAAPTVSGAATAPGTKIPGAVFASLPEGEYLVVANSMFVASTGTASGGVFRFSDGTNVTNGVQLGAFSGTSPSISTVTISGRLRVPSTLSNVTIQVQGATGSGNSEIRANTTAGQTAGFELLVYRFPTTSEQAIRIENAAQSFSGYSYPGGSAWATSSATFADPTGPSSTTLVTTSNRNFPTVTMAAGNAAALTFTPQSNDSFHICANVNVHNSTGNANMAVRLVDGSNNAITGGTSTNSGAGTHGNITTCGIYSATSTSPITLKIQAATSSGTVNINVNQGNGAISWTIVNITRGMQAPFLNGGLSTSSAGQWKFEAAKVTNAGSPSIAAGYQTGGFGTPSLIGTGIVDLPIVAGTFASGVTPICVVTAENGSASYNVRILAASTTASNVRVVIDDHSGTGANQNFNIHCSGPK